MLNAMASWEMMMLPCWLVFVSFFSPRLSTYIKCHAEEKKYTHIERRKRALSACHFPLLAFGFSVCGSLLCVALLSACVTVKCVFPVRSCRLFFSCVVRHRLLGECSHATNSQQSVTVEFKRDRKCLNFSNSCHCVYPR